MKTVIFVVLVILCPIFVDACTVCFGGSDSDLSKGFFWGIVVLGALPYTLLAFFIGYLVRAHKRRSPSQPQQSNAS